MKICKCLYIASVASEVIAITINATWANSEEISPVSIDEDVLTLVFDLGDDEVDSEEGDLEEDLDHVCNNVFDYTRDKIIGVNLGGWLVTEPFISPSLYQNASPNGAEANVPVDEYHFCKQLGYSGAETRLKQHWETWITEADLAKIKSLGFNAVRLPIGYWAFGLLDDDPYVQGQEEYLVKTIQWCRAHGLKLWIDLHGIPGSQNGFDNSGQRDTLQWIGVEKNYNLGMKVLEYIYKRYGGYEYEDVIIGIENLNEPLGPHYPMDKVEKFDLDTHDMMRQYSGNNFVFHDAFMGPDFWTNRLLFPKTVLDHHRYEVFTTGQLRESIEGHINSIKIAVDQMKQVSSVQILGEWSAALTDCAHWLNGVGRGARYDNTFQGGDGFIGACRFSNDYTKMTETDRINTLKIIESQLQMYSQLNGFFFWTWKTENAVEWSLEKLTELGLFPHPIVNYTTDY